MSHFEVVFKQEEEDEDNLVYSTVKANTKHEENDLSMHVYTNCAFMQIIISRIFFLRL